MRDRLADAYTIILADKTFLSKNELSIWLKDLLKTATVPYKLSEEQRNVLVELLRYHPKASEKIGLGIKEIWIERNGPLLAGNRFILVRTDDTRSDFSYKYCLGKDLPTHAQRVREAMRNAVRPYIMRYKEDYFSASKEQGGYAYCEISKQRLNSSEAEVDHQAPNTFEHLVQEFLKEQRIIFRDIFLKLNSETSRISLSDSKFKEQWINIHNQICQLTVIHKEIHKSMLGSRLVS